MISSTDTPTDLELIEGTVVLTDLSNEAYHGQKAHISRSSAHRYRGKDGGLSQRFAEVYGEPLFAGNSSTTFGTLVDKAFEALLSGRDYRSMIAVPPESVLASNGSRRGKAYEEWRNTLPSDGIECNASDFAKLRRIIDSLLEHDAASKLIDAASGSQTSVFWTDENGHKRKARADGTTPDLWFDLKTTSSEFSEILYSRSQYNSFARFGYGWQCAWYSDAARAAGWGDFKFPFIVVQNFPPFAVKVLTLKDSYVEKCREEIRETLDMIKTRRDSGLYLPETYGEMEEIEGLE